MLNVEVSRNFSSRIGDVTLSITKSPRPLPFSYGLIFNGLGLSRSFRADVLCDAHATAMRCACDAQASFKPGSCDVHATFMRHSCDGYATSMRRVCDGYATLCDKFAGNEGGPQRQID